MESSHTSSLLILSLSLSLVFLTTTTTTTTNAALSPFNVTGILDKAGQYTMLVRLFKETQVEIQLINELNNSQNSLTMFAPTDNAFDNLPTGFLNGLTQEQQVKLVNFHIVSKFIVWDDFRTISNPVITQASGPNGPYGLNFTFVANQQVNVSSGLVETTFTNALNLTKPIAVYQIDKVLLPADKFSGKLAEAPAPAASSGTTTTTPASAASSPKGSTTTPASGAKSVRQGWGLKGSLLVLMGLGCMGLIV